MITVRVAAKTLDGDFRNLSISENGDAVECDCAGFDGDICSHIDAVLVANERAMVPEEDWEKADRAVALTLGKIKIPSHWQGAWRKNLRWRGLASKGSTRRVRDASKPMVCFTGTLDRPRADLIREAHESGWETIDSPSPHIDVLVAANPSGNSAKLAAARKHGIPIITCDEWATLMSDGALPD